MVKCDKCKKTIGLKEYYYKHIRGIIICNSCIMKFDIGIIRERDIKLTEGFTEEERKAFNQFRQDLKEFQCYE